jgi:hypothetical protein
VLRTGGLAGVVPLLASVASAAAFRRLHDLTHLSGAVPSWRSIRLSAHLFRIRTCFNRFDLHQKKSFLHEERTALQKHTKLEREEEKKD